MTFIKRTATVGYSARQLFELVNAIEDYPRFLPWCRTAHIIERTANEVEASLEIAWSGMSKTFTTRNVLFPYERIEIHLVNGPFRHLEGTWRFVPLSDTDCQIDLELKFEFTGHFFDKLFQPIFYHMANSLVDLFCKRAVEIYGPRDR